MKPIYTLSHPIWLCGFRSFFLAAASYAVLLLALWTGFLQLQLPLPQVVGGPFLWHAHELLFGFALAAIAGFMLTAVPEFTETADVPRRTVRRLFALWLIGRLAFWLSGSLGAPALALSGLAHLALIIGLAAALAPRLLRDPERKHLSFVWALLVMVLIVAGFYVEALSAAHPIRWLHAWLGLIMILIVMALSRISMRIVNDAIDERRTQAPFTGEDSDEEIAEYRARPPKRNLAIVCIAAYTVTEFFLPGARLGGWLALAAAAALLHLQSDFHVGRALLRRWPLLLFTVYVLMSTGYALMGFALLFDSDGFSAGLHLLTVGALGAAIYGVLNIAARIHCGHPLDERRWVILGAAALAAAALLRAATAFAPASAYFPLLALAALFWMTTFALWLWRMTALLNSPRADGGTGCEEILNR
jgi:uncharacterized protein involved in response to NO